MSAEPQFRREDGAAIRIWRDPVQNKFRSEQEGRPIFDEAIMAEVITPGSSANIPVFELERKLSNGEVIRGSKYDELRQYVQAFESDEITADLSGTPLTEWPEISVSLAATLKASGVHTVDALAALPDTRIMILGPDGRGMRDKAAAYLAKASGTADYTAVVAENARLKQENEATKQQMLELSQRMDQLQADYASSSSNDPFPSLSAEPAPAPVVEKPTKAAKGGNPII